MVEEGILGGVELGDDHMGPPRGQIITCAPHFHQVSWPFLTIHHHLGLAHHRLIRPGCVSHQRLNGSPHCLLPLQPQPVTVCFFVVFFLIHPLIPNSFISLVVDDTFMLQPWSPASAARLPYCSFFFSNASSMASSQGRVNEENTLAGFGPENGIGCYNFRLEGELAG